MIQITATDFKTNFGKYLTLARCEEIRISKNGVDVAVLSAPKSKTSWIDDLAGIVAGSETGDLKQFKAERLVKKYEGLD